MEKAEYNKIMIIGLMGAGKSTLAARLGKELNREVTHIDKLNWGLGWIGLPKADLTKKIKEIIKQDSWIIDGNYTESIDIRLKEADTVIFF